MIGGRVEPQLADEMERVAAQVRARLEDELREAGRNLMRELDHQIDRIDDLLWELRDEAYGLDHRVLPLSPRSRADVLRLGLRPSAPQHRRKASPGGLILNRRYRPRFQPALTRSEPR